MFKNALFFIVLFSFLSFSAKSTFDTTNVSALKIRKLGKKDNLCFIDSVDSMVDTATIKYDPTNKMLKGKIDSATISDTVIDPGKIYTLYDSTGALLIKGLSVKLNLYANLFFDTTEPTNGLIKYGSAKALYLSTGGYPNADSGAWLQLYGNNYSDPDYSGNLTLSSGNGGEINIYSAFGVNTHGYNTFYLRGADTADALFQHGPSPGHIVLRTDHIDTSTHNVFNIVNGPATSEAIHGVEIGPDYITFKDPVNLLGGIHDTTGWPDSVRASHKADILKNSCQHNDTTNRWFMNPSTKYGGRAIEIVDCDANSWNDTPLIWVERKQDGDYPLSGQHSTPTCIYAQHEQTGSDSAFTHTITSLAINSGTGDNDVVAVAGRAIKRAGIGDGCGVWGSAYDSIGAGGIMGLEGHIYQNVAGMVAKDTLGTWWTTALHLYSNSTGSDATAALSVSCGGVETYKFWNGILFDMDAFRTSAGVPIAGTVGLNMARALPYYGIKLGTAYRNIYGTDTITIEAAVDKPVRIHNTGKSYLYMNGEGNSGLILDGGIGPKAGNQNSFIDFKNNSVLKGNIAYTESDGKFNINSSVTTDLSLCSGGGVTTIEKRAKIGGGLDLDSVPGHAMTDTCLIADGAGLVHSISASSFRTGIGAATPQQISDSLSAHIHRRTDTLVIMFGVDSLCFKAITP